MIAIVILIGSVVILMPLVARLAILIARLVSLYSTPAIADAEAKTEGLVGKYFHSTNETNKVECRRAVIAELHSGWYLVQLFEWGSGAPMEQRLVPIEKTINWSFYPDTDAMMSGSKRSQHQITETRQAG